MSVCMASIYKAWFSIWKEEVPRCSWTWKKL